jgi:hypothetical protein
MRPGIGTIAQLLRCRLIVFRRCSQAHLTINRQALIAEFWHRAAQLCLRVQRSCVAARHARDSDRLTQAGPYVVPTLLQMCHSTPLLRTDD